MLEHFFYNLLTKIKSLCYIINSKCRHSVLNSYYFFKKRFSKDCYCLVNANIIKKYK